MLTSNKYHWGLREVGTSSRDMSMDNKSLQHIVQSIITGASFYMLLIPTFTELLVQLSPHRDTLFTTVYMSLLYRETVSRVVPLQGQMLIFDRVALLLL